MFVYIRGGNLIDNSITLEPIIGFSGYIVKLKSIDVKDFLQVYIKLIYKWGLHMATKVKIVNFGNYRGHTSVCPVLGWNLDIMAIQVVWNFD